MFFFLKGLKGCDSTEPHCHEPGHFLKLITGVKTFKGGGDLPPHYMKANKACLLSEPVSFRHSVSVKVIAYSCICTNNIIPSFDPHHG